MAPDRDMLANGLVRIGEDAVAKRNDALLDDYFTEDYRLADTYELLRELGAVAG